MKNSELAKLPINQPAQYHLLSIEEQNDLQKWIERNIRGNEKRMLKYSSYKLKHFYSKYIDNGTFKGAMLAAGFMAEDPSRINWKFKKGGVRNATN